MNTFADFGLLPSLINTLKTLKIDKPTEIQKNAIPLLLSGQSVVGISETGSGKTLTYALPVLHTLKNLENQGQGVQAVAQPLALVLVPSQDLGEQVSKVFKNYTHDTRLRVRPVLGGTTFEQSRRNISSEFEILLATPGRLIQLIEKQLIDLTEVKFVIFDEADQMLDDGFLNESKLIVNQCSKDATLALFSATVSHAVQELINSLFANTEVVRSSGAGKVVKTLITENITVIDGLRWPIFEKLLKKSPTGGTLVFTNTREQCDRLAQEIQNKGFSCVVYRGDMDKGQRKRHLKSFRTGEVKLLIATDLAARGLDLDYVGRVINYHLPQEMANYLHRVGRTARAGKEGLVINLVTERDLALIARLEGKGQTAKELKARFKDESGKRLHVAEELRKPKPQKIKSNKPKAKTSKSVQESSKKETSSGKKTNRRFKPKPYKAK